MGLVILIAGASHTGKTALAQRLLEKYKYPYMSIDHLKMGAIRSGITSLTPFDDEELTVYLWSILKEIVKTVIENEQDLIIEGCYIPFDWQKDLDIGYLKHIRYYCLIMTENYINKKFGDIKKYADVIEKRLDNDISKDELIKENNENLKECKKYGLKYVLIDSGYFADPEDLELS